MNKYYPPKYKSDNFHCPHCRVYAHQRWETILSCDGNFHQAKISTTDGQSFVPLQDYLKTGRVKLIFLKQKMIEVSFCSHCSNPIFWHDETIIYPPTRTAAVANDDLPAAVKDIYEESADIADRSPRAACALLRLALQLLLKHLGESGSINDGIGNLVEKGLDPRIQKAMDVVRVTGNHAVHPGQIAFDDTTDVQSLFKWINLIADSLITHLRKVDEDFDSLPEDDKKAIEKRDEQTN